MKKKDIKAIHHFHIWYKMDQKVLDPSVELNFFNMDSVISPTKICMTQDEYLLIRGHSSSSCAKCSSTWLQPSPWDWLSKVFLAQHRHQEQHARKWEIRKPVDN